MQLNIERMAMPRSLTLPGKAGSNWKCWLYLERLVLPRNYLFLVRLQLQLKGLYYCTLYLKMLGYNYKVWLPGKAGYI
jgi:hypothetical protein